MTGVEADVVENQRVPGSSISRPSTPPPWGGWPDLFPQFRLMPRVRNCSSSERRLSRTPSAAARPGQFCGRLQRHVDYRLVGPRRSGCGRPDQPAQASLIKTDVASVHAGIVEAGSLDLPPGKSKSGGKRNGNAPAGSLPLMETGGKCCGEAGLVLADDHVVVRSALASPVSESRNPTSGGGGLSPALPMTRSVTSVPTNRMYWCFDSTCRAAPASRRSRTFRLPPRTPKT